MNRTIPTSTKPVLRRPALPVKKPEHKYPAIEQRHWRKLFLTGLILIGYRCLQFLAPRPQIPNIFNDPAVAGYWVMVGLLATFIGLVVRTWGTR